MDACLTAQPNRTFHGLTASRRMHLLDKPHGYVSGMAKDNLAHQMRYSVSLLEGELVAKGDFHVLQLKLEGPDPRTPQAWELFADGASVASGTGEHAFECFCADCRAFLDLCRAAVDASELPAWSRHDYDLLCAARRVAVVEAAGTR